MDSVELNEAVAGGKGTLILGGETYLVDPLTDRHFGTFSGYIRKRMKSPLESIAASLKGLPLELQKAAVSEATRLQASGGMELTRQHLTDQLSESEPLGFLVWLLVRETHPDTTPKKLAVLVEAAGPESVLADLYSAAGLEKLEKN